MSRVESAGMFQAPAATAVSLPFTDCTIFAVPLSVATLYDCTAPFTRFGPPMDVFDVVKIPTALIFNLVGTKWVTKRGCRVSHAFTCGVLWLPELSITRCN